METTDVSTALDKIMQLPGMPASAREAVRGVLEDLWVDARHGDDFMTDDASGSRRFLPDEPPLWKVPVLLPLLVALALARTAWDAAWAALRNTPPER